VVGQLQGKGAGEVLDGTDLLEYLTEALVEEPLEGFVLNRQEIGKGEYFGDLSK
jgi:hypothetical protein